MINFISYNIKNWCTVKFLSGYNNPKNFREISLRTTFFVIIFQKYGIFANLPKISLKEGSCKNLKHLDK